MSERSVPDPDLLFGAGEIAIFLYGTRDLIRRVYHQAERGYIPTFRLGRKLCARRSQLLELLSSNNKK